VAITRQEVLKIADLAKLQLSEAELEAFTVQFQRILEYIEKLKEVDVEGVEPTSHVSLTRDLDRSLFRDDETRPSLLANRALANAPDPAKDHFRVPKVI
jgi:aspartyl-tRNA(Asn)/glutamyl-tRNA(Gln) amidotransferase subunit C